MLTKHHNTIWDPNQYGPKLNIFGSFRVLVNPEAEVVQNRQFIPTSKVICNITYDFLFDFNRMRLSCTVFEL